MEIGNYKLEKTCGACPEAYDVFLNEEKVGYLRLRNGYFRAEYEGEIVYEAEPDGDGLFDYEEREGYLNAAIAAIDAARKLKEDSR